LGDGTHYNEEAQERPGETAGQSNDLALLGELVRKFAHEREWGKYHNPRSLILALMGELGELAELFQWRTDGEASDLMRDPDLAARVTDELADVFGYLLQLADVTGVNLGKALEAKIRLNEERYPAHLARGNARKYTELGGEGG
jgi:dCTP diphosphatase